MKTTLKIIALLTVSSTALFCQEQVLPTPTDEGTIVLANNWESPIPGSASATKDLGILLSPFFQSKPALTASKSTIICGQVHYLMPLEDAKKALNLPATLPAKVGIVTPGFPKDSLVSHGYEGVFEGRYNKLFLITDRANQVVSVQLVAENPEKEWMQLPTGDTGYRTYNFVTNRNTASDSLVVGHKVSYPNKAGWMLTNPRHDKIPTYQKQDTIRIDSTLHKKGSSKLDKERRGMEAVRWYVPRPLAEIIMHCIIIGAR